MPDASYYGDYPQLENGVGMWALLREEFTQALETEEAGTCARRVTAVTGKAVSPLIESLAKMAEERFNGLQIRVVPIENRFFGSEITVSGLLTGRDILEQTKVLDVGDALLFPASALRQGEEVFLDDRTPRELSEALGVPVLPAPGDGAGLLDAFLGNA